MKKFKSQFLYSISVALLSLLIVSCGGGSNAPTGTNPADNDPNAAKWDSLIWDTDNWN